MNSATAVLELDLERLAPGADVEERRGRIEIVPTRAQRRARPRLVYPVVGLAGIGVILLGQLGLSMVSARSAFRISELQTANTEYSRDVASLTEQQRLLSSTQNLAQNAAALGMVSNAHRVYLKLSDGSVTGTPVPASAADGAVPTTDLVPNALLNGIGPVVAQNPAPAGASAGQAAADAVPSGSDGGVLPSPQTR